MHYTNFLQNAGSLFAEQPEALNAENGDGFRACFGFVKCNEKVFFKPECFVRVFFEIVFCYCHKGIVPQTGYGVKSFEPIVGNLTKFYRLY